MERHALVSHYYLDTAACRGGMCTVTDVVLTEVSRTASVWFAAGSCPLLQTAVPSRQFVFRARQFCSPSHLLC